MVSLLILCFSAFPLRTLETVVTEYPVRAAMDESVSFIDECYSGYNKVKNIIQNDKFNANVFAKKIRREYFFINRTKYSRELLLHPDMWLLRKKLSQKIFGFQEKH